MEDPGDATTSDPVPGQGDGEKPPEVPEASAPDPAPGQGEDSERAEKMSHNSNQGQIDN